MYEITITVESSDAIGEILDGLERLVDEGEITTAFETKIERIG